jgi:hypothetical protein
MTGQQIKLVSLVEISASLLDCHKQLQIKEHGAHVCGWDPLPNHGRDYSLDQQDPAESIEPLGGEPEMVHTKSIQSIDALGLVLCKQKKRCMSTRSDNL